MLPEIVPIISPNIDWNTYLYTCKQILGFSVSEELDHNKIPANTVQAFITTTKKLKKETLKHSFFSFLVVGSYEMFHELMEEPGLLITVADSTHKFVQIAIVTASLETYSQLSIKQHEYGDIKLLMNKFATYFYKLGILAFTQYNDYK